MGWFDRLFGREQKASAAAGVIAAYNLGRPVWSKRDYSEFAREAYVQNPVGYRCARLIAGNAAQIPYILKGTGDKDVEEHPLLDLLMRPAPMIGGASVFEAFYTYLLLSGNGYLEAAGPRRGQPNELWCLRPDRMEVIPGKMGYPEGYKYTVNGQSVTWDVDPVKGTSPIMHVKEFNPAEDWYGLSRVDPAAYAIDRHNAASAHNKALLDNGARPSGALVFKPVRGAKGEGDKFAPAEAIQTAEKELTEHHVGPGNAGKPLVTGGNVDWLEMGISPKDMDFGNSKDDAARDICSAFGVPHVLVVHGESTYNNRREAKLELYEDTILPLVDKVTDALNAWLCPMFGDGLRLEPDLDEIDALEPRRESKRTTIVTLLKEGVLDRNEAREALQYGPREKDAVGKVDAQVLNALVQGLTQGETAMFEPLYRYLKSVGLIDKDTTLEAFTSDWANGALPDDVQGMLDGVTPDEPPNGEDTDG